jgi:peptidyl-prolyl cis-trans isomerase D
MLQNIREKSQGLITWFIVLFIVGAFAFLGLTEYFSFGRSQSVAAKVNGEKISWRAVDTMYQRLSRQYGNQMDPRALKEQIRMGLVQRVALMSNAKALGFRVGDEQIANALLQIPAFQESGKFSKERYLKILSEAAYSDLGFRQELSHDILLGQLEQGLTVSSFTLPVELNYTVSLLDQKRDLGYLMVPIKHYEKEIQVSAEDNKKYYDSHKEQFVKPEQVSLEYVEISLDALAKQINVSKEQVLAYYNEHKDSYSAPERVRVRHILIPAQDTQAKEKVENLLTEIKEKKGDFQKLAKKHSVDKGSAEKGGDLGWFARGQMVPEFEKVAFELNKPGDVSGIVETKFGFHILQLVERKDAEVRPFSEAQALVEEQLKGEKAQALFTEKGQQLTKLAFEQTSSLAPIAEQLGLKIQETGLFSKDLTSGNGIASHPEIVSAAFSEAILKQGHNSGAIKVSENTLAVIRVKSHVPAVQQTHEMVEKQIQEKLLAERAKVKAKEMGEALAKRIVNGEKPAEVARQEKLEWKTKSDVVRMQPQPETERNIVMAAFQIPSSEVTAEKPGVKGLVLPTGDYTIVAVTKIKPGELSNLDTGTRNAYQQSLTDVSSQLEFSLYANQVLKEAKIEFTKEDGIEPPQQPINN